MAFTELQEHPHDVTACIHLCSWTWISPSFFFHSCWFTKIFHFFKSWKGQRMDALHFPRISACLGLGSASLSWEAQFSNDLWGVFQTWLLCELWPDPSLCCRFAVMACCWALDPEERPKFQQLVQCLTEFHAALGAYVWKQWVALLLLLIH